MNELTRTNISTAADSAHVYKLAFQAAGAADLPAVDQIRFACIIVDLFFLSNTAEGDLMFRIGHNHDDQPALQVLLQGSDLIFETILPSLPSTETIQRFFPASTEPTLQLRYELLQQRSRDMEQFAFAVSHELKNSLTKLKLAVSLLEIDDDPENVRKHFQIIQRSSAQLEHTLLDLNNIIQIKHNTPVAKYIRLEDVFSKACEELEERIQASNASISTDFSDASGLMYVEVYLQSIFSNLLTNAIKYSDANRRPEIVIKAVKHPGGVQIVFSDNGVGIDLDRHKNSIFKPFSRFSSHIHEGKGLGLYIIKSMIERNNGNIQIKSRPNEGTTFLIELVEY
ncbi:HAMP domain-containing histidine kinase [Terrimonas sp. NA20]|uniref:histidine kinase n=1 Tax=Terrimonas ginsenosidimutans TaxID=2908004 RepID=A0ABS9KWR0_9BACT|nr:HAMP domain-containing sensor histidine kinase [Terrimonas ginsenosidimutans]MCG2616792.1 HAMP domain-containing histidine kinase [Terrimonas ginsenosidimutans]